MNVYHNLPLLWLPNLHSMLLISIATIPIFNARVSLSLIVNECEYFRVFVAVPVNNQHQQPCSLSFLRHKPRLILASVLCDPNAVRWCTNLSKISQIIG